MPEKSSAVNRLTGDRPPATRGNASTSCPRNHGDDLLPGEHGSHEEDGPQLTGLVVNSFGDVRGKLMKDAASGDRSIT